jgi:hypothetical protein
MSDKNKEPYQITSADYFRILIAKNPAPSNDYIKNYGELCKAEAEHKVNPTAQTLSNLERQGYFCEADILRASIFSYDKREVAK